LQGESAHEAEKNSLSVAGLVNKMCSFLHLESFRPTQKNVDYIH